MFKRLMGVATLAVLLGVPGLVWGEPIVVGQLASFNGNAGPDLRIGIQTYFNAVNAAGGIGGAPIKFVTKDRGLDATAAVGITKAFVREHQPLALVGLMGTGPMNALVKSKLLEEEGIPVVGIRSGAVSLHEPVHPFLFHTRANYLGEMRQIARQLTTVGLNRVAVIHEGGAFGKEGLALAKRAFKEHPQIELVGEASFPFQTTDVADVVQKIVSINPHGVIVIANSAATAEIYKAFRLAGGKSQVIAISTADGGEVVKRIGAKYARGLIVTQVVPNTQNTALPVIKEIQGNLKKYGPAGAEINQAVIEGYLAAKTLAAAVRAASPNPTRRKVVHALESMNEFDTGGVIMSFSPSDHTGSKYVELAIILPSGRLMR